MASNDVGRPSQDRTQRRRDRKTRGRQNGLKKDVLLNGEVQRNAGGTLRRIVCRDGRGGRVVVFVCVVVLRGERRLFRRARMAVPFVVMRRVAAQMRMDAMAVDVIVEMGVDQRRTHRRDRHGQRHCEGDQLARHLSGPIGTSCS